MYGESGKKTLETPLPPPLPFIYKYIQHHLPNASHPIIPASLSSYSLKYNHNYSPYIIFRNRNIDISHLDRDIDSSRFIAKFIQSYRSSYPSPLQILLKKTFNSSIIVYGRRERGEGWGKKRENERIDWKTRKSVSAMQLDFDRAPHRT